MSRLVTHPDWCNRPHRPGSTQRRQTHQHVWKSDPQRSTAFKVALVPYRSSGAGERGCALDLESGRVWLSVEDVRALASELTGMADAVDAIDGAAGVR